VTGRGSGIKMLLACAWRPMTCPGASVSGDLKAMNRCRFLLLLLLGVCCRRMYQLMLPFLFCRPALICQENKKIKKDGPVIQVYGRRVNSFVLVLVFHHTDTSLYLLSLALALSIHNKLKLYRLFLSPHSLSVTTVTLGSRLFFILLQINLT
jgi:hypothetical protein